jgi:hypothetical protein
MAAAPRTDPPTGTAWAIQTGSYRTEKVARDVVQDARRAAGSGEVRVEHVTIRGLPLWRASVVGLTEAHAQGACATLERSGTACVVIRPSARVVASR